MSESKLPKTTIEMSLMDEKGLGEDDISVIDAEGPTEQRVTQKRKFSSARVGPSVPRRNVSEDTLGGYTNEGSFVYDDLEDSIRAGLDKGAFQKLVEEKKQKYHIGQQAAEVEVVIDRLIEQHGRSLDRALIAAVTDPSSQEKVVILVTKLLYRGADARTTDDKTVTPLHYAARRGHEAVAERLVAQGASPTTPDIDGVTSLGIAFTNKNDKLTALLIRHTDSAIVRTLFSGAKTAPQPKAKSGSQPAFSLHEMIEKKSMQLSVMAVLDSLVENTGWTSQESVVYYPLLEADRKGNTPDSDRFNPRDKTCLQLIARTANQDYIGHPAVRLLVKLKWKAFARNRYVLNALVYLATLLFLTASVILALESPDPSVYNTDSVTDMGRAACEAVVGLVIIITLVHEVFEAAKVGKDYFKDWFNYLDILAIILLGLVIPLRFLQRPGQWGVYSMGYLLFVVRIFKFSAIFRRLKTYSQIIWRMTTREFVDFLLMFAVVMLAFTGSFSMALRIDGTLASTNNIRTSDFWNILLTSSRVLIEDGPVLDYYNNNGHVYGWYATILFLAFLFVSMVMLLNILIAQLSDTYESMRRDAQLQVYLNRAWIVARVELNTTFLVWRTIPRQTLHGEANDIIREAGEVSDRDCRLSGRPQAD